MLIYANKSWRARAVPVEETKVREACPPRLTDNKISPRYRRDLSSKPQVSGIRLIEPRAVTSVSSASDASR